MSILQVRRDDARTTVAKLIATHRATIFSIEYEGKTFWKDGEDITRDVRERCIFEITQCKRVLDAIDHMGAGEVQKAAELCSRIQERINGR